MAELDELLSSTLKQAGTPGDPSGVADAIRTRVEAGESGTPAASSTAPGWGGGGVAGWLPWVGVVVIVGLVGGAVGVSGLAGSPAHDVTVVGSTSVLDAVVDAGSCPGGPTVRTLSADTRVLAVARSDDSAYLGVRNPDDVATTIWVPASVVVPDDASGLGALPVGDACPVMTVVVPVPVVVPVAPVPGKPTKPGSGDTTPPTISAMTASPKTIYNNDKTTITVTAADNVGVTGVTLSWTGGASGSANMTPSGGKWIYIFSSNSPTPGDLTFKARAVDAAGNVSAPSSVFVSWQYFG